MSMIHLVNRADNAAICGNKGTELVTTTHLVEVTCGRCKMVAAARAKKAEAAKAEVQVAEVEATESAESAEGEATKATPELPAEPLPRCECSKWAAVIDSTMVGTGCELRVTRPTSLFRQGHDMKLRSLQRRADAAGVALVAVAW